MNRSAKDPSLYYQQHVFCCTNLRAQEHPRGSCGAHGSEKLRLYLKARTKELGLNSVWINSVSCLNRCESGPVLVIYPEGIWYTYHTNTDVDEILQTHIISGERVERLLL